LSVYFKKFRANLKKNETARGLFIVAIIILAAIAIWGGIRLALNTQYPILVVSSGSMCQSDNPVLHSSECTLPIGSLIVIRGVDPTTITNGSIIIFMNNPANPGYLIVHRVVGIVPASSSVYKQVSFRTKGDANPSVDCWTPYCYVPGNWVEGVYMFTIPIPYLGSAILDVRDFLYNSTTNQPNPQGILVILALIVALFAFEVIQPGKKSAVRTTSSQQGSVESNAESSEQHTSKH
jgi:signal peptidase I